MEEDFITRKEHEEFNKGVNERLGRLDDENKRQNRRIDTLENIVNQINSLTVSVEKLAISVENIYKEMERERQHNIAMDKRIKTIELKDGEMWRKVVGYAITAVMSVVIGFIFAKIGM